jgi:uncharacterized membrane protein
MDKAAVAIAMAITILAYVYVSAIKALYYIFPDIMEIGLVLALISALLFFIAYQKRNAKQTKILSKIKLNPYIIIGIILLFLIVTFQFITISLIISIFAVILFGIFAKKLKKPHELFLLALVIIITATALSSVFFIYTRGAGHPWPGVDELAYNYYSATLFLKGVNPYTANMVPSLSVYNTIPTVQLNGTIVSAYSYPALSFLPIVIFPILGMKSYNGFLILLGFISIFLAIFIYYKSNYNNALILPIAVWLFATYLLISTAAQYLAVAFLILAYAMRKRKFAYPILLGLAASTIQLAWFAIPFFYILTLREEGKKRLLQTLAISIIVFFLINGYFILQAPKHFFDNVLGVFISSNLAPIGSNIMQFLITSYNVPFFVPAAISIITMISLLILFYLYTSTLKSLIAIVPAFIFFLSWRNLQFYGLAFIPLIILICYLDRKEKKSMDLIKRKSYIIFAVAIIVIICISIVVYYHMLYARQHILTINYANAYINNINGTNTLYKIQINITNSGNKSENVSFLYVTYSPYFGNYTLSPTLSPISPHSYQNYSLNVRILNATSKTRLYILAFSKDGMIGKEVKIG